MGLTGVRTNRWLRLAAAVVAGGVMSLGLGGVAAAEPPAEVTPTTTQGLQLINAKNNETVEARIFALPFGPGQGGTQLAYCIEYTVRFQGGLYVEKPWKDSGIKNLGKVQWILTHSYPTTTPQQLIQAASAKVPADANEDQLKKIAYAATQAAIWTLTDADTFALAAWDDAKTDVSETHYNLIRVLHTHLLANAAEQPEAEPTLTIDPQNATGVAGTKIGPFTVKASGGGTVSLKATGGKVVDQNGNAITSVQAGGKFWLTSDNAGTVTVEAEGSGSVPTGRIFVRKSDVTAPAATAQQKSQRLILAGSAGRKLKAQATATVKAKPTLPVTGASVTVAVASGVVLLGGGALLLMAMRRRRVNFTA